jgi:omega-amidase
MNNMLALQVTTIQYDIFWEDVQHNLEKLTALLQQLPTQAQLVVLPEMFTTGFTMNPTGLAEDMNGQTIAWMKAQAKTHRIILCGSIIIKENKHYYNRFISVMPNAQLAFYNKRHLFAKAGEHEAYTAGNKKIIIQANGLKILPVVCYDIRFPVWCKNTLDANGIPTYDVLLVVANWPSMRIMHWQQLLIARAIENQCYVVAVNRVGTDGNGHYYDGNSTIIDPMGNIIYTKKDVEDMFTTTITKTAIDTVRTQLPFLKDSDAFDISC